MRGIPATLRLLEGHYQRGLACRVKIHPARLPCRALLHPFLQHLSSPCLKWTTRITVLLAFALISCPGSLSAEGLDEVLDSQSMQRVEREAKIKRAFEEWFVKGSNLELLFRDRADEELLSEWLAPNDPLTFRRGKHRYQKTPDYIKDSLEYRARSGALYTVETLIPHPHSYEGVRLGLYDAFAKHYPPKLKIKEQLQLRIAGASEATMFREADGGCSIAIKAAADTLITVSSTTCNPEGELQLLAESLSISRFNDKISS